MFLFKTHSHSTKSDPIFETVHFDDSNRVGDNKRSNEIKILNIYYDFKLLSSIHSYFESVYTLCVMKLFLPQN